jgi:AcrR family transcriptional regulator
MAAKRAPEPELLITAFAVLAEQGWAGLSLTALAARTGLSLVEVHRQLPGRRAILLALSERVDEAMLAIDQGELALPKRAGGIYALPRWSSRLRSSA